MMVSEQGFELAARIWKREVSLEEFAAKHAQTLPGLLGIQLVEVGPDFARATMPVDSGISSLSEFCMVAAAWCSPRPWVLFVV
jgi:acyl-coenzyme A thioesterase PaaI-like protein